MVVSEKRVSWGITKIREVSPPPGFDTSLLAVIGLCSSVNAHERWTTITWLRLVDLIQFHLVVFSFAN